MRFADIWSSLGLANALKAEVVQQGYALYNEYTSKYNALGSLLETATFTNMSEAEARKFVAFIDNWLERLDRALNYLEAEQPEPSGRVGAQDEADWRMWFEEARKASDYISEVTEAVKAKSAAAEIGEILKRAMKDFAEASGVSFGWVPWVAGGALLLYAFLKGRQ